MVHFSKNAHDDGIVPTGAITPEPGTAGSSFQSPDREREASKTSAPAPGSRGIGGWENEGGAIGSTAPEPLPEGVTAETVMRYRVGKHVYGKLDEALAEQRRRDRRRS